MTEDEKQQVASFRFGVICDLVNGVQLASGEQEQLLRDKCARKWQIPFSNKTRISRSTILRWMRVYKVSVLLTAPTAWVLRWLPYSHTEARDFYSPDRL